MNCPFCWSYGAAVFGRCCEESIRYVEGSLPHLALRNADFAKNCPATIATALVEARWSDVPGVSRTSWGCLEVVEAVIVRDDAEGVTVCWVPLGAKRPWSPGRDALEVRMDRVWVFTQEWVAQGGPVEAPYPRGKMFLLHIKREAIVPWPPIATSIADKLAAEQQAETPKAPRMSLGLCSTCGEPATVMHEGAGRRSGRCAKCGSVKFDPMGPDPMLRDPAKPPPPKVRVGGATKEPRRGKGAQR